MNPMNTPRQNIETALSRRHVTHPGAICYEGIYVRDHWSELTDAPWWHESSPDVAQQMVWRNDVLAHSTFDWFELPGFLSARDRAALAIEERAGGIYRVDRRTGVAKRLEKPTISGWAPARERNRSTLLACRRRRRRSTLCCPCRRPSTPPR